MNEQCGAEDYELSLGFASGENKIPSLTASSATAPTLSATLSTTSTTVPTLNADTGYIATEYKNGKLYVHLAYSLFDSTDTKQESLVGSAVFKFVYDSSQNEDFDSTEINEYALNTESAVDFKFEPAYEVAVSYDGQSSAQLGNWVTTAVYSSATHGDKDGKTLIEDTTKFTKDVTYLIGAPATFQISLKDYYNIITGDFINWSRRPYDFTGSSKKVYESSTD